MRVCVCNISNVNAWSSVITKSKISDGFFSNYNMSLWFISLLQGYHVALLCWVLLYQR